MSSLSDLLLYAPVFSDLPSETVDKIAEVGVKKKYKRNEIILREEENGGTFFVIIEGKVKEWVCQWNREEATWSAKFWVMLDNSPSW